VCYRHAIHRLAGCSQPPPNSCLSHNLLENVRYCRLGDGYHCNVIRVHHLVFGYYSGITVLKRFFSVLFSSFVRQLKLAPQTCGPWRFMPSRARLPELRLTRRYVWFCFLHFHRVSPSAVFFHLLVSPLQSSTFPHRSRKIQRMRIPSTDIIPPANSFSLARIAYSYRQAHSTAQSLIATAVSRVHQRVPPRRDHPPRATTQQRASLYHSRTRHSLSRGSNISGTDPPAGQSFSLQRVSLHTRHADV